MTAENVECPACARLTEARRANGVGNEDCRVCRGTGRIPENVKCQTCIGTRTIHRGQYPCPDCTPENEDSPT